MKNGDQNNANGPFTPDVMAYRQRMQDSVDTFTGHKKSLKNAWEAYKQILPDDILIESTNMVEDDDPGAESINLNASKLIYPALTIIAKKSIEDLTAIPPRYEYQAQNKAGEIARVASEYKLRVVLNASKMATTMEHLLTYAVIEGLGIAQVTTRVKKDVVMVDGKEEVLNNERIVDMNVYSALKTYLDPNSSSADIPGTSNYIIVTVGIYDEHWVNDNFPEYFASKGEDLEVSPAYMMGDEAMRQRLRAESSASEGYNIDDGEDDVLSVEAGVDKSSLIVFKVREYYEANTGYFRVVINDEWLSKPIPVPNGRKSGIPFVIVQSMPDTNNPYGMTLYDILRNPIVMASRAINQISDASAMNQRMPFFVWKGANLGDSTTMTDWTPNTVVPVMRPSDIQNIRDMFYRPEIKELSKGAEALMQIGEGLVWMLAGTNSTAITGQQSPQIQTNGIAQMLQYAARRSNSAIARRIETLLNTVLWYIYQVFYIYYPDFGFDEAEVPREYFKDFKNIRVVPGSYLPEDIMSRIGRAQEVLNVAMAAPDAFELEVVIGDWLRALGVAVPDRILKDAEEQMAEQLAMIIAQSAGEGMLEDPKVKQMIDKLVELAARAKDDGVDNS